MEVIEKSLIKTSFIKMWAELGKAIEIGASHREEKKEGRNYHI